MTQGLSREYHLNLTAPERKPNGMQLRMQHARSDEPDVHVIRARRGVSRAMSWRTC